APGRPRTAAGCTCRLRRRGTPPRTPWSGRVLRGPRRGGSPPAGGGRRCRPRCRGLPRCCRRRPGTGRVRRPRGPARRSPPVAYLSLSPVVDAFGVQIEQPVPGVVGGLEFAVGLSVVKPPELVLVVEG